MEYEIKDDPQGLAESNPATRDGGLAEDHIALKRLQSAGQRSEIRSRRTGADMGDLI